MSVLKFRIQADDQNDFVREVEIKSDQTFKDLHDFIVNNQKLNGNELASFHVANESWEKEQEITLIDMSGDFDKALSDGDEVQIFYVMSDTRLDQFITRIDQKLIYEYDFLQMRTYLLEVADISEEDRRVKYPRLVFSRGKYHIDENIKVEKDSEKLRQDLLKDFNLMVKGDHDDDYGIDDDY